jgi:PAS domain S-box-containing protein
MSMESETDHSLQMFANTGSGVWAVDASQRIVFWNQAADELLGFTADQALGRLCYQLLAGQDTQGHPFCQAECHRIRRARQHDPVPGFEMLVRGQDGELSRIGAKPPARLKATRLPGPARFRWRASPARPRDWNAARLRSWHAISPRWLM